MALVESGNIFGMREYIYVQICSQKWTRLLNQNIINWSYACGADHLLLDYQAIQSRLMGKQNNQN